MDFVNHTDDPFWDGDYFEIYDDLFAPLEARFGPLDDIVLSSPMMMFGMSFMMREQDGLYVTYEPYHLVETKSREGLRFALFAASDHHQDVMTAFLEELARWVLQNEIGEGDEINLANFETEGLPWKTARVSLFSRAPDGYGLYEITFPK
ncbi:MAG: hypothetical protein HUJ27_12755 [Rhodobacteraceae bacterium]|nr:hypothetical protein [Paracoccaceae bacterium]